MKIFTTADGSHTIISDKFGVSYHSKHGAIAESEHVFIKNGLLRQLTNKNNLDILEIGFGTGLNAFLTLLHLENTHHSVHYTAYEAYPLELDVIKKINYPEHISGGKHEQLFLKIHECAWKENIEINEAFTLHKINSDFHSINAENAFDLIYFDAFAPSAQPELWDTPLLEKIYQASKYGALLTTYCAQGQFKRNLKEVGFQVESIDGPPGKREMTLAYKVI